MKVLFLDIVHPVLEDRLKEAGYTCLDGTSLPLDACLELFPEMSGLVIRSRFRLDERTLSHADNLKFIARSGAGMENIDVNYCSEKGIALFNAPEGNRNAVAEHALGMLLALFNNFIKGDKEVRSGIWDREGNRGLELDGKTVGIIGFGNNGSAFARKLAGFDVKILAHDKYKSGFGSNQVEECSLEAIFEHADIVSFHIPQNEETIYYADNAFFESFQKPIYLVNLARGKIVQTEALVSAIKSDKVLGCCLDVLEYEKSSFENFFEQELSDDFNFLLHSDKVIFTPHVGGWTKESYFKLSDVLADKILNEFGRLDSNA